MANYLNSLEHQKLKSCFKALSYLMVFAFRDSRFLVVP